MRIIEVFKLHDIGIPGREPVSLPPSFHPLMDNLGTPGIRCLVYNRRAGRLYREADYWAVKYKVSEDAVGFGTSVIFPAEAALAEFVMKWEPEVINWSENALYHYGLVMHE